jgi:oligoendopeptidase F
MDNSKITTVWDFSKDYSGYEDKKIDSELENLKIVIEKFREKYFNNQSYLSDANELYLAITEYDELIEKYFPLKCSYFAHLSYSKNQQDEGAKKLESKISQLSKDSTVKIQFFTINISKIPKAKQEEFLNSEILSKYKYFLEKIFEEGKHTLNEESEKILTLKSNVSHSRWEDLTSELLSKKIKRVLNDEGKMVELNYSEISTLFLSNKKAVRDSAFSAMSEIYNEISDVGTAEFNAILENKKIDDELRKYQDPQDESLLGDEMEREVVDNLVKIVSENYSIVGRFYNLKAKLLGVDKIEYQDRNTPIGKFDLKLSYTDAVNKISEIFTNFDNEIGETFDSFLSSGMIDVYPTTGKRHGAFCSRGSKEIPPYILLNYEENFENIQTIAHESGHAINHKFINDNNFGIYRGNSLALAEVASTFFENLVTEHFMNSNLGEKEEFSLLMNQINDQINTIFRQISFYETEIQFHREFREKYNLSTSELGEIFKQNLIKYSNNSLILNGDIGNFWIGVPHFRYFFYVYSYASGLLISNALLYSVKNDKVFVKKVKQFLKSGGDKSPTEIFKELGIDLKDKNFWISGIKNIEAMLERAEVLAKKLDYKI